MDHVDPPPRRLHMRGFRTLTVGAPDRAAGQAGELSRAAHGLIGVGSGGPAVPGGETAPAQLDVDAGGDLDGDRSSGPHRSFRLPLDPIAQGTHAAVAPIVQETVEVVGALISTGRTEVSLREITDALRLDKSAASRRIASAVQAGYLRNLEDRKGRPARVCLGEAMPEELPVLPPAEVLHC